ncbi:hypothetical protein [Catalinimonas alkaloidigena]|uniref:hypothetical protein n=1 Tax=Catalinimonas alkaloidigena TaxID=1075417 RepID=UPI00115FE1E8|nr:hypothetical protein [Catalinimonas alkaloidigena]
MTFTRNLDVSFLLSSMGSAKSISEKVVYDPLDDEELDKYANRLQTISIIALAYKVDSLVTSPDNKQDLLLETGTLSYTENENDTPVVLAHFRNLNVADLYAQQAFVAFPSENTDLLAASLMTKKTLRFYITGTVNQTPVTLGVTVRLNIEAKAGLI